MTTIACNRDEMYGDLQFTSGGMKWKGSGKVFRFPAHDNTWHCDFLVGFTGVAEHLLTVKDYFTNPEQTPPRIRGVCCGLVLTEENEIYRFENYRTWLKVEAPYAATGSGMEFAMGAMAAGLTPKEAVRVAMQHDIYTGLGVKGCRI